MTAQKKVSKQIMRCMVMAAIALSSACSNASPPTSPVGAKFAKRWAYATQCDSGHFLSLDLHQQRNHVTGEWSEGTNLRGGGGKLEGDVRNGKLYVRYCSDDGEAGYEACPKFSGDEDYFVLEQGALVRYQKFGSEYKRDVALRPDVEGQQIPAEKCADTESGS
ncbi:hypothetical protein ABFO19_03130 [Xanthomonas citri pv. glycines]|uniref:hypothetical protein n=1 Tax=Xanthomonas TaxID=338 RepID=UPI000AAE4517|nr:MULTISPECIES: hypothetical protein [Xanthomonas]UIX75629.1 hypothetical protein LMJ37_20630 [Xanthomonas citri pv. glycines]WLA30043.1 hypothetical protein NPS81_03165 [Xanthomonas citri pv. glycines]